MPTTIGQLDNVPVPGDPIASPWAQEASGYVVHPYATAAALNAGWPAAPNGSLAVTLDTSTLYVRKAGVWQPVPSTAPTRAVIIPAGVLNSAGPIALGSLNVPAVPYPRLIVVNVMLNFGGATTGQYTATAMFSDSNSQVGAGPGGCTMSMFGSFPLAAGVTGSVTLTGGRSTGAEAATIYSDGRFNRLETVGYPT